MHDFDALLDRLKHTDRPVAFVVGAPLSESHNPPAGVPGVKAMIERVEAWARHNGIERTLAEALGKVGQDVGARYQAAFEFVDGRRGYKHVDQIVHDAVLAARQPGASPTFDRDGHPADWHLPRGTAALGRLLVEHGERFTGPVITTNFDPLISLAITAAGGRPGRRILAGDGALPTRSEIEGEIPVIHLHGYWRDPRTRHQPKQLTAKRPQLVASLRSMLREHIVVVLAYGGWDDAFMKALAEAAFEPDADVEVLWALYPTGAEAREAREALVTRWPSLDACAYYEGIDAHALLPALLGEETAAPSDEPASIRAGQPGVSLPGFSVEPGSMIAAAPLIDRLRAMLDQAGHVASVVGFGGLGKSRLAWEYAHAHRADYPGGIFWFEADQDPAGLDSQLARIAVELRWVGAGSDPKSSIAVGKRALRALEGRALFIFDNVEGHDAIGHLLPDAQVGHHVLLTSRHEQERALLMDELAPADGVALLEATSGRALTADDRAEAEAISVWAEGLPLALELIGAYLNRRPTTTWAAARDRLGAGSVDTRLLEARPGIEKRVHRHATVRTALRIDPDLLTEHPLLARALDTLTALAPAPMSAELLAALVEPEDADGWADDLELGCTLKLMTRDDGADGPRYRMHRLLRAVYQRDRDQPVDEVLLDRLGTWAEARRYDWKIREGPMFGDDTAHVQAGAEQAAEHLGAGPVVGRLLWLWGSDLEVQGDLDAAERALERARAAARPAGAADSALAVEIDVTFAIVVRGSRGLALSRAAYDRARALGLGPEQMAGVQWGLAEQLMAADQLDEARDHAEAALAELQSLFEPGHWRVAQAQGTLGQILARQREPAGVELARAAFAAVDEARSPATQIWRDAAITLSDALNSTHRFTEALDVVESLARACRQHLGPRHPSTFAQAANVGRCLAHLRRFAEARAALTAVRDEATAALGANSEQAIDCTITLIFYAAVERPPLRPQAIARLQRLQARLPAEHPSHTALARDLRTLRGAGKPPRGGRRRRK